LSSQADLDAELFTESVTKVRHMMYFDSVMTFMNSPEFVAYGTLVDGEMLFFMIFLFLRSIVLHLLAID
jgi:hypothetical protein